MGGWNFQPWEGVFYPDGLPKRRQLEYASHHVTAIEVNATYYASQKPETIAKWGAEAPDGFVFAIKGNRFVTNRKVLADAGDSLKKFFAQRLSNLGDKLGPIMAALGHAPGDEINHPLVARAVARTWLSSPWNEK